jgi:hypothetical protein
MLVSKRLHQKFFRWFEAMLSILFSDLSSMP